MKTLECCIPRQSVLDGSEDFVVNLSSLADLSEAESREFLDSNVLTSGMEDLIVQVFDRISAGGARAIYKLSEAMGGGKTQSMIVSGILARFPALKSAVPFSTEPKISKPDFVVSFTGRDTDKNIWVAVGEQLGVEFSPDSAPSEKQWADALKNKNGLILLDELAFYLVHASTIGDKEEGARFSQRTAIALTGLFGAVRDLKEAARVAVVVADLQKDWAQGQEELARIMSQNSSLSDAIHSADKEMSKSAVAISPVDSTKDELYAILRKRLFKEIQISDKEKVTLLDGYFAELETAKRAGLIERPLPTIKDELASSYPFHFSTKHLIGTFNENPGFQKTRDVIRLMAAIVRSIWAKGSTEVSRHRLLALTSADLNDAKVASRFKEIKRSLSDALQTDIANSGSSYAESLSTATGGLSVKVAKWIYAASLSETRPRGLKKEEIAEYLAAPGEDITGLSGAIDELSKNCWYLDQLRSGSLFFNRVKNLNAQINSYFKMCSDTDRDDEIESKLKEMFEPREKRCYQTLHIHPDFSKISLARDKTALVICHHDAPYQKFFADEKFKNRVAFLTLVDPAGLVRIRNHAKRLWAIRQVLKDMSTEDAQYEKAREERTNIQTELFMALRSVYARLWYPLGDPATGDSKLTDTTLLDSFTEDGTGQSVKFEGDKNSSKGELVIESTLRAAHKFQTVPLSSATDRVKSYRVLRTRVENFLFPSIGRATWEQILDSAATRGIMVWAEPGTLERMKDTLLTAGEWREQAGQIMKPPFVEEATVSIEYDRDSKTGKIITTDIKLLHADSLYVSEDGAAEKRIKHDEAYVSEAMVILFQARDSTGRNKDGKPTRIENRITIDHDFLPSTTPGHRTLKLGIVPKDASVKWTSDGSDPANHGAPYATKGIEVKEGATVKVFAEKASTHAELSIPVPKEKAPDDDSQPVTTGLDLDKPATLASSALRSLDLVSRLNVHGFLSKLPAGTVLAGCRAKTVKAETDNRVAIAWDAKTRLEPDKVLRAFDFLDGQIPDAEWELEATGGVVFPTGRALIEWQKENSIKIAPNLVTQ